MKKRYKMRKIKPTLRKIRKAFTEMWRKEYEEKCVKNYIMENINLYFNLPPIEESPVERFENLCGKPIKETEE